MIWPSGAVYMGTWADGARHGAGTFRNAEGPTYVGEFRDGERAGRHRGAAGESRAGAAGEESGGAAERRRARAAPQADSPEPRAWDDLATRRRRGQTTRTGNRTFSRPGADNGQGRAEEAPLRRYAGLQTRTDSVHLGQLLAFTHRRWTQGCPLRQARGGYCARKGPGSECRTTGGMDGTLHLALTREMERKML